MRPGEWQAITECAREAVARAWDLADRSARHGRWQPSSPSARTTSVPGRMPNARAAGC
jgi:hypothetical protein